MTDANWVELGDVAELREPGLRVVEIGKRKFALSFKDGQFGLIDNVCNHVGGPLGEGKLDGDYVVCPWHQWKFHRCTGLGEPGFEADKVPGFTLKEEGGKLFVDRTPAPNATRCPTSPTRWRARLSAPTAPCASSPSPPPPWTSAIRATPHPMPCSRSRSSTPNPAASKPATSA